MIPIAGYTMLEKVSIAQNHLVPKQIREHGLSKDDIDFRQQGLSFIGQCEHS